ncbi:AGE family epimerase/isomerase [Cobetia sp. L2A1]|uniref:AGE family epimerase/isomerase n=1 Tax=Cobetia sp. L2A1 TaxID=2686360 RepID=UPI002D80F827|nr:AGE family epimerase/isomerase [Cobetia sp. L2A1]
MATQQHAPQKPARQECQEAPTMPESFASRTFLDEHIRSIMAFYLPRAIDHQRGGYFQAYKDDGTVYAPAARHLVSSTRMIFNFAMEYLRTGDASCLYATHHGIRYLREVHLNPQTGGYLWSLDENGNADHANQCYGLAFVMLAYATAHRAGVEEARGWLEETHALMERHFWSETEGLYADEASADWQTVSDYRGQNANMHACEAMLAAFEATGDEHYLNRAMQLASNICQRQAAHADGLIWEHYDRDWNIDWDYNREDPKHLYRPWGFQPGHLTEWAKLLLMLKRHRNDDWLVPTAQRLFDTAMGLAWDSERGGLYYGFAPDGTICDDDKYFWVQAESLVAAALLYEATGDDSYVTWYNRLWQYAWAHLIDHRHGGWYRILDADNQRFDDLKSSPGAKCDYHSLGACHEVLRCQRILKP